MLEKLVLNTRQTLPAAARQYSGWVDALLSSTMLAGHKTDRISRIMDGIFHEDGGEVDSDAVDDGSQRCDLGPESEEEWERTVA